MEALKVESVKYEARAFSEKDHEMLAAWWSGHKWPVIPLSSLPIEGVIVEADGVPAVAGFCYQTDSDIALMEWIVSNPEVSAMQRARGLDLLIDTLTDLAKAGGARLALTFIRHDRLKDRVKAHGFIETDTNMTHLLKEL